MLLKASQFILKAQLGSKWIMREAQDHCYMTVWPMVERQQFKSTAFTSSYFQHTQLLLLISHAHKMLFFGLHPQIHLLLLLEVPKAATFGCSVELTGAWQHISPSTWKSLLKQMPLSKESDFYL